MFARIILILLFPIAWPIYFVIWCCEHPEEVRHSITSVRDLIRRHPKRTAWLGVVFGGIGVIGHVLDGEFLAMAVGAAVVGWCGWLLIKWNRQEAGAAAARAGEAVEVSRPARPTGSDDALFVYGTLQFPEVLNELIGRSPESVPAEIPGWRVAALPGRVYPGLVPDPAGVARGVILSGLDAREWEVLDAFEDDEYELRRIRCASGPALAYVWTAEVAAKDWVATEFAATHLAAFITRCWQWRTAS
ncbi:gamma-glutamylcyclotransferase family protein [Nocardia sp. NPDC005366]|uniref:gamma-glutamylcyclotransferase family protein n=1 Tax=Nocardia sp. NPDC005366 TaxID=3156878 RepID=UPI0033A23886